MLDILGFIEGSLASWLLSSGGGYKPLLSTFPVTHEKINIHSTLSMISWFGSFIYIIFIIS